MDKDAEEFVERLWRACLGRALDAEAKAYLLHGLATGRSPIELFLEVDRGPEAEGRRAWLARSVATYVPAGHFYSPVVDVATLPPLRGDAPAGDGVLPGIAVDYERMKVLRNQLFSLVADLGFPQLQSASHRYFWDNPLFCLGDALVLAAMVRRARPSHIVEVGSGFSSAAILDVLERTPGLDTSLVFIEPDTGRLDALLRPDDLQRTTILRSPVQQVPVSTFDVLDAGDILVLDTTHVSKTGSDVNHEMFDVLPRLKPGVIVHVHDVFDGFEYPDQWVYQENRSWNEIYLLRAFLMYNDAFEILYANHAMYRRDPEGFAAVAPAGVTFPGGSLWLRKR
jgi:hypothetical protein